MRWSEPTIRRAVNTGSSLAIDEAAASQIQEEHMKSLAAVGAAAFIAAAGLLWFMSGPMVVTAKVEQLKPSADVPVFRRVER
jgi:hypothetical protein